MPDVEISDEQRSYLDDLIAKPSVSLPEGDSMVDSNDDVRECSTGTIRTGVTDNTR